MQQVHHVDHVVLLFLIFEKKEKKEKDSVNKYLIEIPVLMTSKEATVKHPKWIMLHSLGYTMEMAGYALAINHNSLQASSTATP